MKPAEQLVTISSTRLRREGIRSIAQTLKESGGVARVTRHGETALVLMTPERYRDLWAASEPLEPVEFGVLGQKESELLAKIDSEESAAAFDKLLLASEETLRRSIRVAP